LSSKDQDQDFKFFLKDKDQDKDNNAGGVQYLIAAYYSDYRPRKDERLSWPS